MTGYVGSPLGVVHLRLKSYYRALTTSHSPYFPWKSIWKSKVPSKVAFFSHMDSSSGTNFYHGESLKEYMPWGSKGCGALVKRTLGQAVKPRRLGFEQPCVY